MRTFKYNLNSPFSVDVNVLVLFFFSIVTNGIKVNMVIVGDSESLKLIISSKKEIRNF